MEDLTFDSTDISWDMTEIETGEGQNVYIDSKVTGNTKPKNIKGKIRVKRIG